MSFPLSESGYELLAEVGKGATATVYRGRCIPLDKEVAIKIIDLDKTEMGVEQFHREVVIMSKSNHPSVLKLHASFVSGRTLWLVLVYYPFGSIADVRKKALQMGSHEPFLVAILYQTLEALEYFHENGQMHRDVKAANLLVDESGHVAMADFGVSAEAPPCRGSVARKTLCGTPCWMAPEVLTLRGYRKSADIWSLGITALEIAFGAPPFAHYPPMKAMALTLRGNPPTADTLGPNKLSPAYKNIVRRCLQKDPANRPTATELKQDPLFEGWTLEKAVSTTAHYLSKLGVGKLQEKSAARQQLTDENGGAVSWLFPSTTEAQEDSWRTACAQAHEICSKGYRKGKVIESHGRLTVTEACVERTGFAVEIHEIELDQSMYDEPLFTADMIDTILAISDSSILAGMEIWENGIDAVYWVTEAKGVTLSNMLQKSSLTHSACADVVRTVVTGLSHLHQLGIMHRRVMPQNIFFTASGIKLGAVASSIFPCNGKFPLKNIDPPGGVEAYLAPEQFDEEFTSMVDIYALGMLIIEMLTGKEPYSEAKNPMKLVQLKLKGTPPQALSLLDDDDPFRDLVTKCIIVDPKERISLEDIVAHPAIQNSER
eukprot:TRINITY_DN1582_c0_g2_i1.p1 TRINITY_DN1582_c0_g2~~TRINITY_DN1582_c0_g2_i1.p1  ORF type:complete len:602 (+),score=97.15 TRINITY_DN1582_c0_g2_i1:85-1890(+)